MRRRRTEKTGRGGDLEGDWRLRREIGRRRKIRAEEKGQLGKEKGKTEENREKAEKQIPTRRKQKKKTTDNKK